MVETTIGHMTTGLPGGTSTPKSGPPTTRRVLFTGSALAAAVVIATMLAFGFIAKERERDIFAWQTRLGIVAASRAAAVEDWIDRQFEEIKALANNPSLAIYLTEIKLGRAEDSAETEYLRNLLKVTAARAGFQAPVKGPDIRANVRRIGVAGLLIMDKEGRLLVSTPNPPPNEGSLRNFLASLSRNWATPDGRAFLDIHRGPAGELVLGFAMPIFAVQSDPKPENQIGVVVGIKPLAQELYPLLVQPGTIEQSSEVVLVRRAGDVIEYLSPLKDGSEPLERNLAANTANLAAAYALSHPGGFVEGHDYRGEPVLATSARIKGTLWTLMHKVDAKEALGPIDARLERLLVIFLLAIGLTTVAMIAVWYKGASRRAAASSDRFEELANRYGQQRNFLRLLTDNQPSGNTIIDATGVYRFANEQAAKRAGISKEDMLGKTLLSVLGPDVAKRYEALNRSVLDRRKPVTALHRFEDKGNTTFFQSKHIPMPAAEDLVDTVLLVEEDITEAMGERERRERMLRQLIDALVAVVDRRDPYAAHHSNRVSRVASAIAEEMDLGDVLIDTAETAGELLNLGKILVPENVLTKTGRLTPEEMKMVHDSILTSAELIEGIEFDGPVADTLRQCQERWDGEGFPQGLNEGDILVTARVVAVANAFVALTSPRAHRKGIDFDAAVDALLADVGKAYDRRVVAALASFLDNKGGRRIWADFVSPEDNDYA